MFKKILFSLIIGLFGLLNSGSAFAGFFNNTNSNNNNFSASTLFFNLTEANGALIFYPLFYSSDLKPDDAKTASFKIKKEGIEDFKYNIYFVKTNGSENLCKALKIEVKMEGVTYYSGDLPSLSILPVPVITDGIDEWEFVISFPRTTEDLREKNCSFDLVVKGWQIDSDGSWGFSDTHSLNNNISTTTWEMPSVLELNLSDTQGLEVINPENNSTDTSDPQSSIELTPSPTPTPAPEDLTPTLALEPALEAQETPGKGVEE